MLEEIKMEELSEEEAEQIELSKEALEELSNNKGEEDDE